MLKRNPMGRPMKKLAPKVKVLISCYEEDVQRVKDYANKLNNEKIIQ